MASNTTVIKLPRFARDIAVLPTAEAVHPVESGLGILRPFSGLLDTSIEQGRVPAPDLSHLTLDTLVTAALFRGAEESPTIHLPGSIDSTDAAKQQIRSDADGEPLVRDLLSGEQGGDSPEKSGPESGGFPSDSGPNQTLADVPPQLGRNRLGRSATGAGHDLIGRTDNITTDPSDGVARERSNRQTVASTDPSDPQDSAAFVTDSFDAVDLATVEKRGSAPSDHPVGEPSLVRETDRDGPVGRAPFEADINPYDSAPKLVVNQSETNGAGRQTQNGRPSSLNSNRATPQIHSDLGGPRMTVREDSRASDDAQEMGAMGERQSESANGFASADTLIQRRDPESGEALSRLFGKKIAPESRFVDRLYSALREREAIERRRRGGP